MADKHEHTAPQVPRGGALQRKNILMGDDGRDVIVYWEVAGWVPRVLEVCDGHVLLPGILVDGYHVSG
uniref:Uncharacterized protein n=1 Tax=Pyricularia oryzae (strain 70-15 / ATCC MYA-4617 / FGSC 8958) TaxID=242507 RepID=Q2KFN9_PYRO7|nr:hypothetical protein MGCH7_ch7g646 [Pyricularia oryzae 70-15]